MAEKCKAYDLIKGDSEELKDERIANTIEKSELVWKNHYNALKEKCFNERDNVQFLEKNFAISKPDDFVEQHTNTEDYEHQMKVCEELFKKYFNKEITA